MGVTAPARQLFRILTCGTEQLRLLFLSIALVLGTVSGRVAAYDMNPFDVDCWGLSALCPVIDLTRQSVFSIQYLAASGKAEIDRRGSSCNPDEVQRDLRETTVMAHRALYEGEWIVLAGDFSRNRWRRK